MYYWRSRRNLLTPSFDRKVNDIKGPARKCRGLFLYLKQKSSFKYNALQQWIPEHSNSANIAPRLPNGAEPLALKPVIFYVPLSTIKTGRTYI
jgi:hypothetical protein